MSLRRVRGTFETLVPYELAQTAHETSTRAQVEVDPRSVGISNEDIDAIWNAAVAAHRTGLYPALGLCIRRRGQVVLDRTLGYATGGAPFDSLTGPKQNATPATLFNLFSASKMVTAMLVHLCDQRGLLHLDDPVTRFIPEYGKHGKHKTTIRHVLNHRAGIPRIPREVADVGILEHPDQVLALLCDQKPAWRPGSRLAYHALTGGFILGAIVERAMNKPLREVMNDEILRPLRFDAFNFGVPKARLPEVAQNAFTGPPIFPLVAPLIRRSLGVDFTEAVRISNDPRFLTSVVPAGNIVATSNEASRFMQLLLNGGELDGVRIFEPRTLIRAIAEQSYYELDLTMGIPIRYSMGFMLGDRVLSPYGLNTQHAFGHLGLSNIVVYADPARDLAVSLMTSGKPAMSPGILRTFWIMQVIAKRIPRDGNGPLMQKA